jgi:hypothetical protein
MVITPVRHGLPRASLAGASNYSNVNWRLGGDRKRRITCMKAVATMTPDPKYFAMKNAHSGTPKPLFRLAKIGKTAPSQVSDVV